MVFKWTKKKILIWCTEIDDDDDDGGHKNGGIECVENSSEKPHKFHYFQHKRQFNENYANLRDDFIRNSTMANAECDERQNPMNASQIENGQLSKATRRMVRGFPDLTTMNQLDGNGNRNDGKDSTNNQKRKLTR